MNRTWTVVADNAGARIFSSRNGNRSLDEVHDLVNPAARLRAGALEADRPGRSYDSMGGNRHAMEPGTTAKEKESLQFARHLGEYIYRHVDDFDRLVLVCPPGLMGRLKKQLKKAVHAKLASIIQQDLTHLSKQQIEQHLAGLGP